MKLRRSWPKAADHLGIPEVAHAFTPCGLELNGLLLALKESTRQHGPLEPHLEAALARIEALPAVSPPVVCGIRDLATNPRVCWVAGSLVQSAELTPLVPKHVDARNGRSIDRFG